MPFKLPTTATAPFCPSEVKGSVAVATGAPFWKKILQFAGPGLLISIGYMDPGNWATDIEAGSRYGYDLLFVVVLSSLVAMVLQILSMRLGIVTGKDLAQLSRERYSKPVANGHGCWRNCRSSRAISPKCSAARSRFTCCSACRCYGA